MSTDENGGGLTFYDAAGVPRIGMIGGPEFSELILFGQDRKRVLHFQVLDEPRSSVIAIFDSEGGSRLVIGTSPQDTSIAIYDEKENVRAVLGTTSKLEKRRTESSVSLFTETGEVIWEAPE
jgi:hypothetical protein